jgi:hypothetical protein
MSALEPGETPFPEHPTADRRQMMNVDRASMAGEPLQLAVHSNVFATG